MSVASKIELKTLVLSHWLDSFGDTSALATAYRPTEKEILSRMHDEGWTLIDYKKGWFKTTGTFTKLTQVCDEDYRVPNCKLLKRDETEVQKEESIFEKRERLEKEIAEKQLELESLQSPRFLGNRGEIIAEIGTTYVKFYSGNLDTQEVISFVEWLLSQGFFPPSYMTKKSLNMGNIPALYGYCPKCGESGMWRERRPNGNDKCFAGHVYPSKDATAKPLHKDNL